MEKKTKTKTFQELYEEVSNDFGAAPQADAGADDLESQLDSELNGGGEGEDEVTVTLPRSVAQQLIDVLQATLGGDEGGLEGDGEMGGEGDEFSELPQESADADEDDKEEITEEDEEGEDEEPVEEANECIDGQDGELTKQKVVTKIDSKVGAANDPGKHGSAKAGKNSGDKKAPVTKIDSKVKSKIPAPGKDFLQKK